MTKEHLWPVWIRELLPEELRYDSHTYTFTDSHHGEVRRVQLALFDLQVKEVCAQCNNGWMSRLEQPVRPVIQGILEGRGRELHPRGQTTIAQWGAMKAAAYGRRNVLRELRRAQKAARDTEGRPTFPVLQQKGPVPARSLPTFHGFRHTAASEAIAAGDGAEEVSWQLGHKNSTVTRAIYVQQIRDAEQRAKRRDRMEERYGSVLGDLDCAPEVRGATEVIELTSRVRPGAQ